jgi:hypothetical protein
MSILILRGDFMKIRTTSGFTRTLFLIFTMASIFTVGIFTSANQNSILLEVERTNQDEGEGIYLTWNVSGPLADNIRVFDVFRKSKRSDGFYIKIGTTVPSQYSYSDFDLVSGTEYTYMIEESIGYSNNYDGGMGKVYSNEVSIKFGTDLEKRLIDLEKRKNLSENEKLTIRQRELKDRLFIKGKKLDYDVAPFIENRRTMIPVRKISESLLADVDWEPINRKVLIKKGNNVIELFIDSTRVLVNGDIHNIDVPAQIFESRTFVPLRFVSQVLGEDVYWDSETHEIDVGLGVSNEEEYEIEVEDFDYKYEHSQEFHIKFIDHMGTGGYIEYIINSKGECTINIENWIVGVEKTEKKNIPLLEIQDFLKNAVDNGFFELKPLYEEGIEDGQQLSLEIKIGDKTHTVVEHLIENKHLEDFVSELMDLVK